MLEVLTDSNMGRKVKNSPRNSSQPTDLKSANTPSTTNGGRVQVNTQANTDSAGSSHPVQMDSKRRRRSTGGTFAKLNSSVSKESFIRMTVDDKLVTLFDLMSNVTSIDDRVSKVEQNIHTLNQAMKTTDSRLSTVEYKGIDLEARHRRNNLIFRGIPELLRQENCSEIINIFLQEKLGIKDRMYIQRAHRLGLPARNKTRPIIVCFRDYGDVEYILSNSYKLKGLNFGINRDYPPEIVEARSRIWPRFKQAREENPRGSVKIAYPAKLIVKGEVVQDEFPAWKHFIHSSRGKLSQPVIDHDTPVSNKYETIMESEKSDSSTDSDCESNLGFNLTPPLSVDTIFPQPLDDYSQMMSQMQSRIDKSTPESTTHQPEPPPEAGIRM